METPEAIMGRMDFNRRFHTGDRLRIRDNIDSAIYLGMSTIGNEAVVDGIDEDRFGLPTIHVTWDKNHWTYNGAPDCWTFEDHFDIVEGSMDKLNKQDQIRQLTSAFGDQLASIIGGDEQAESDQVKSEQTTKAQRKTHRTHHSPLLESSHAMIPTLPDDEEDEHTQALETAAEHLADAEGFVLVLVRRVEHPKAPEGGMLMPYALAFSQTPEASLLADAHMSVLASQAHQDLIVKNIRDLHGGEDAAE